MRRLIPRLILLSVSTVLSLWIANRVLLAVQTARYRDAAAKWTDGRIEMCPPPRYYQMRELRDVEQVVVAPDGSETHWKFSVNEDRLRGPRIDVTAQAPGAKRILFLGDSYTFGDCVGFEDCFVSGVQRRFEGVGKQVLCINAGITGYNTEQEYGALLFYHERYRPDVVVVGYVSNDAHTLFTVPRPPEYTYRYSLCALLEESKPLGNWLGYALVRDEPLFHGKVMVGYRPYHESFEPHAVGWRNSRHFLGEIHAFCRRAGIRMQVFVLPDFTQRFDAGYELLFIHDAVCRWGAELGFPVRDMLPVLLGYDNRELHVRGDGHPNPKGHDLLAAAMFETLAPMVEDR